MDKTWLLILCALQAYLLGCLVFSYIIGQVILKRDIRKYGSGNAGTANMMRNFGKKLGILTFVGDCLKGVAAVLLGRLIGGELGMYISAIFVVVGHNWPVFLRFKGGKGIAATLGVFLVLTPIPAAVIFVVVMIVILLTKIVAIGSLTGIVMIIPVAFVFYPNNVYLHITTIILAAFAIFLHRENIKRLFTKKENKLDLTKHSEPIQRPEKDKDIEETH